MVSTVQQVVNHVLVAIMAIILLGGTMLLLVLGKTVPEFLIGFDGVIVTAAFANGAFFVQARTGLPVATALQQSMTQNHALAMAMTTSQSQPSNGTTELTAGSSAA